MALTDSQKSTIRDYLGYGGRFWNGDNRLENAFMAIALTPTDEAKIVSLLASCADIDTRLADALNRTKASAVGSITLNPAEIGMLKSEGRRFVNRIASLLQIAVNQNAYGGSPMGGPLCHG